MTGYSFSVIGLSVLFGCLFEIQGTNAVSRTDMTTVLNNLLANDSYDKRVRPNFGVVNEDIGVTMYLISVRDFSDKNSQLTTDFYFRQTWKDNRLTFDHPGLDLLIGDEELGEKIWTPDTFIAGARTDLKHNVPVFVRISKDGTIFKSVMVQATTVCQLDLTYFPYDTQTCSLYFESYGFSATDIKYEWMKGAGSVGFSVDSCSLQGKALIEILSIEKSIQLTTGNYSVLEAKMKFRRTPGNFLRTFFGPAVVFMLLTYSTFWLPASFNVIFRGICLLTGLVCQWMLLSSANDSLPPLAYPTRLDQYLSVCFILSALAVLEFVVVIVLRYQPKSDDNNTIERGLHSDTVELDIKDKDAKNGLNHSTDVRTESRQGNYLGRSVKYLLAFRQHERATLKADVASRIVFAVIFVLYNLWFWLSFPANN